MKIPRFLVALVAGIAIGAALTAGTVAVEIGASGTSTTAPTWYGCLSTTGALTKVGAVAPSCSGSKRPISWNSFPANANGLPRCTGLPRPSIDYSGCDMRGVIIPNGDLTNSNFSGANLSGAMFTAPSLRGSNFAGANLTNATFCNQLSGQYSICSAAIVNVDFTNANLKGLVVGGYSNVIADTWSNTICPDGTNSDSDGGTCSGHLTAA